MTRTVDTGQGGENDPNRALASIMATPDAPEPAVAACPRAHRPLPPPALPWLGRRRAGARAATCISPRSSSDPNNPNSATEFYITVDGETPRAVRSDADVRRTSSCRQGDVEDWIIENRSTELHAFHIHQLHFLLLDWSGMPVNEPFLRDTVNVPYFNGRMLQYPSVRLRMDFRDPEHRRHLRLSLSSAGARRRRHDGTHSRRARAARRAAAQRARYRALKSAPSAKHTTRHRLRIQPRPGVS